MRRLHSLVTMVALAAFAWLTAGPARGQIKLPIYDPDESPATAKGVSFEPATQKIDFKHGTLLRVTTKDNRVVRGTLVRVDKPGQKLYIRTEPGTPPVAVAFNDIKTEGDQAKVERGMVEVARKPAPGSPIKQVEFVRERVVQPEISAITLEEGPARSSFYTSNVLSPGERTALAELSQAEREVARLEVLAMVRAAEMGTENAMVTEKLRTQQLLNLGLAQQIYFSFPYSYGYTYPYASGYGFGTSAATIAASPFYGRYGGWGGAWNSPTPDYSIGAATAAAGTQPTTPQKSGTEALALTEALAKARERLNVAQTRAVIEDGQVIAVVYEKPSEKTSTEKTK
jgi:hypothetical protein